MFQFILRIVNKLLKIFSKNIKITYEKIDNPFFVKKFFLNPRNKIIIFDVGSHYGKTIIQYSKIFPNHIIHAFEPTSHSFLNLKNIFSDNNQIILNNIALSNYKGTSKFFINKSDVTNSLSSTEDFAESIWGNIVSNIDTTIVNVTTLDEYIHINNISKIDILKVDVQGEEYNLLEGAVNVLKNKIVNIIYIEILVMPTYKNQRSFIDIISFLNGFDYVLYNFYNKSIDDKGRLLQFDAIFINSSVILKK